MKWPIDFQRLLSHPANRRSLGASSPLVHWESLLCPGVGGGPQTQFCGKLVEVALGLVASSFDAPTSLLEAEAPGSCFLAEAAIRSQRSLNPFWRVDDQ